VNSADATVNSALRAGTAVGLALVVGHVSSHPEMTGFFSLGALTSIYLRWAPYRRRATLLALTGAIIIFAVLVGSFVAYLGWSEYLRLAVVAGIATTASLVMLAAHIGPPGPMMAIFAAGAAIVGSPTLSDVGLRTAAAVTGAAIAWVICMSGYLVRPSSPAAVAVQRALRGGAIDPAHLAQAREVLADDLSHKRTAAAARKFALFLNEQEAAHCGLEGAEPPSTSSGSSPETTALTLAEDLRVPPRKSLWQIARDELTSGELTVPVLRIFLGTLIAALCAQALGWGHASWAAIGAAATLQGRHIHTTTPRALQRAAGTALGALLAWPLLEAHLSFWGILAVVVTLQVVTEIIVLRNYAAAMLTITPMALMMTSIGDTSGGQLALDRALTTVLGAVIAVAMTIVIHDTWRLRFPSHLDVLHHLGDEGGNRRTL
jgi:Fusaric acid resistance protein-like